MTSYGRMVAQRNAARLEWARRLRMSGLNINELRAALEEAGALGFLHSNWSSETGINKVFTAVTRRAPALDLSCEDYGLVFRLAERNQGPVLRVTADAEALGEVPLNNVIAEVRGSAKPNEYVLLSAHFDSYDGASGATDNGTGSVTMLEAMRILKQVYPNPRRTIIAAFWNSEEQGLNGSRAFVADHPEIVQHLHAVFNQDNGTGRVQNISGQGLLAAGEHFARWLARLPGELTRDVRLNIPGTPGGGGSDYASFVCAGAPGFGLSSLGWDYGTYTWHTNRDTFDKLVFDDLRNNAVLVAMLTYLASEDPELMPRDRRTLAPDGTPISWPTCRDPMRTGPPQ
jgi:Zn-dependent M28 family amino/carboxypeptidase